ncbi:MAG: hydrophobic/amphiphilic exporter-1 (mainly G- bacteria) HAE1 family [Gammaproteobacteria bacterium]|nr:MAG: hydrophobic/amphiphilic exporter-1 (mainly G- bacteria) HAE1 family [Gammaproteobacteria bacterium]TND06664.1 MAG: hydrophobic/amphiphilic exporter-1 (mainly G- bacteria), HAE1 family [Gammaproteobacteria bacterium]
MSNFFIDRPIFASVLAIIITLSGLVAMNILPIAQYPEISPPTVTITASYPGASAETLAKTVAAPIEEQLSGVENLLYFNSTAASNGTISITATFEVGTDVDKATFNVNNRVQLAAPRLPDEVRRNGVTVAKRSQNILLVVALNSPNSTYDMLYLSNYATQNVLDNLKRIPGAADVFIFGARDYSMRVWLKPDRMAQLGLTVTDITNAINSQNAQYAAGKIGADPAPAGQQLVYTVTARGRMLQPEEFGNIILRSSGPNGVLKLKDVARIELGAQSYDQANSVNGQPAVALAVFLQSGANAIEVAQTVRDTMAELKKENFPDDVDYLIPYDTTRFVSASIKAVIHTLLEAAALVLLVVFVFLQTWRATLIPMIAVPVSLIGTFAGLWLFGFSINTLTLFAMVLAVGIVVDDAIVVLENVERLMRERKLKPFDAAVEAMREVQNAVIGIVLALIAVFIPVAFLGGIAGQLYRQFAVTVAIAVALSGIVALTLTPTLCAVLLKPRDHSDGRMAKLFGPFNRGFSWVTEHFLAAVRLALSWRITALTVFAVFVGIVALLFWRIPGSFVPPEDQGYIISAVVLPDGATLERTMKTTAQLRGMMADNQSIENIFIVNGFDLISGSNKSNAATIFMPLKPWQDRPQTAQQLVQEVSGKGFMFPDGIAFAFNPPAIRGLGATGGFEVYVRGRTDPDPQRLAQVTNDFVTALGQNPALEGLRTLYHPTVPQLRVEVDREKAIALGVPVSEVFGALQAQMGSLYVNDFNKAGRTYRVTIQADAEYRSRPEDLGNIYVRSTTTQTMIPLKALITVENIIGPEQIERYEGYIAAKVLGSAKAGFSSGEAIKAVEQIARQSLPKGYDIEWTGQAFQEKRTGSASVFAFGFALIMVYLILAALYERWGVPVAVVLAVPFALLGALGFVYLRGMDNNIYFQIGLVVLIGLAAKNAILIAEFAMQGMEQGMTAAAAAVEAARLRFRPIVMTSLAFVFGVVPLVLATGAGAAARQSMGTGVFGGMIVATFIAPIFVPLFFTLFAHKPRPSHHHDDPHPVVTQENKS